jgi:hypothetical protein
MRTHPLVCKSISRNGPEILSAAVLAGRGVKEEGPAGGSRGEEPIPVVVPASRPLSFVVVHYYSDYIICFQLPGSILEGYWDPQYTGLRRLYPYIFSRKSQL